MLSYWVPPLAWILFVNWWSGRAFADGSPDWLTGHDKLAHVVYFGGVALLVMRALRGERRWPLLRAALGAFLFAAAYGAWEEYQQGFDPARTRDLWDFVADLVGAFSVFVAAVVARGQCRGNGP